MAAGEDHSVRDVFAEGLEGIGVVIAASRRAWGYSLSISLLFSNSFSHDMCSLDRYF